MGRKRNRAAQRAAGVKPSNYKSKTTPCYRKYQQNRKKTGGIGHAFYRYHRKRTSLKCQLATELGLPLNTKFVFRFGPENRMDTDEFKDIEIYHGTVAVINKADLTLVLAVRCSRFRTMDEDLRNQFNHSVSTIFKHARARNECKINGSHKPKKKPNLSDAPENEHDHQDEEHVCGWMGHCGWRGGTDEGKSLGAYAMSAFTATSEDRMLTDKERMERFHIIRDFLAGRFASLSLFVFKTNLALGLSTNVPGFDEEKWQDTPNGMIFASNIAVSCDGFANRLHVDKDHTRYAFGLFGLINRETGQPCSREEAKLLGSVEDLYFIVKDFGIKIALSRCSGLYEMLWDTKIAHYTTTSRSLDAKGNPVPAKECKVTQFGSSCQISETLVHCIQLLEKEREGKTPLEWEEFRALRVKTYIDENSVKMTREKARQKLRADLAREKLAAKVNALILQMP